MSNAELNWATKVASILTSAACDFEREINKLEYKWKVERSADAILALPEKFRREELSKLEFWFGLDVHRAIAGTFDGEPMWEKSQREERSKGWSTD